MNEEPRKVTAAPAMNGIVSIGDRVAVAVREGNVAGMRIGTIIDAKFWETGGSHYNAETRSYEARPLYKVKLHVEQALPYPTKTGYNTWVFPDLVVKLAPVT